VTCPHPKDWRPTRDELQRILSEHVQWLTRRLGVLLQIVPNAERGRANLCNADLGEVDLSNAQLSEAILNNARVDPCKKRDVSNDSLADIAAHRHEVR
jgi:Pentapeptide repeats (8 copies)